LRATAVDFTSELAGSGEVLVLAGRIGAQLRSRQPRRRSGDRGRADSSFTSLYSSDGESIGDAAQLGESLFVCNAFTGITLVLGTWFGNDSYEGSAARKIMRKMLTAARFELLLRQHQLAMFRLRHPYAID